MVLKLPRNYLNLLRNPSGGTLSEEAFDNLNPNSYFNNVLMYSDSKDENKPNTTKEDSIDTNSLMGTSLNSSKKYTVIHDNVETTRLINVANQTKSYKSKISSLNNRINKLKMQEQIINSNANKLKHISVKEQLLKHEKQSMKNILNEAKSQQIRELEYKKKDIMFERHKRKDILTNIHSELATKNKKVFHKLNTDKSVYNNIKHTLNQTTNDYKHYKYNINKYEQKEATNDRNKQLELKILQNKKSYKNKLNNQLQIQNQMKDTLIDLEAQETKLILSLQTTLNSQKELKNNKKLSFNNSMDYINGPNNVRNHKKIQSNIYN